MYDSVIQTFKKYRLNPQTVETIFGEFAGIGIGPGRESRCSGRSDINWSPMNLLLGMRIAGTGWLQEWGLIAAVLMVGSVGLLVASGTL